MTDWFASLSASWNWIDYAFSAVVLFGLVTGILRGLSHELAVLLSYVFALLATRLAYAPLADFLSRSLDWPQDMLNLLAVLLALGTAILVLWGVRLALGAIMSFAFKGWFERVGGGLAGAFRWGVLALLLLHVLSLLPWSALQRTILYDSAVGRTLIPCAEEKYNQIARDAYLPSIDNPTGVRLDPNAVYMPPVLDE